MEPMTRDLWLRRGSSVVFHPQLLGPLIEDGCLVSLRTALGWLRDWPDEPPGNGSTVLVGGLEAALEVMDEDEADVFLRGKVKGFVQEFQSIWDQRGLVFGFGCPAKRFKLDSFENVLFRCPGDKMIPLSAHLWNGSAGQDMFQLMVKNEETGKQESGGFYVRRLS